MDIDRTCDDTLPSWESLEYSQRFVTKTCVDTIASGIKDPKPAAEKKGGEHEKVKKEDAKGDAKEDAKEDVNAEPAAEKK